MEDLDLLAFLSNDPIDKVVQTGTTTIVNSGATSDNPQQAFIVDGTVANTYGKKVFARVAWSVDGGANYQSLETKLLYTFIITPPGTAFSGLQAAMSVGVRDWLITFRTANAYHGAVTDTGVSYTYTPISQTFLIKYALFEVE